MSVPETPIHVLVADDHPIVREGIVRRLASAPGVQVVGEASNSQEVLVLAGSTRPDVIVLDAVMPGMNARTLVMSLKKRVPHVKVLVFSAYDDRALVRSLLRAGVDGYLLKEEVGSRVVNAVQEVARGGTPLSERIAAIWEEMKQRGSRKVDTLVALTDREREVLVWMAQGLSNQQIAEKLYVTERTVKFHVSNILGKLGAQSRVEAVRIAIEEGWVKVE